MAAQEGQFWSIGVDFGTAFSKAALARHDGRRLAHAAGLKIGQAAGWMQPFLAPSILYLDGQAVFFGPNALRRLAGSNREQREMAASLKSMLGARSYQETLDYYPRRSVDPAQTFRVRELIILYLAYLLTLIDAALAQSPGAPPAEHCKIRFCRPGWLPDFIAAAHEVMVSLFERAFAVKAFCGAQLLEAQGISYEMARKALDQAHSERATHHNLDGGVYEASAVALCYFEDPSTPDRIVIVDVGAGTTDVAGLVRMPMDGAVKVVGAARRTIDVAGDYFDAALLDLLVSKAQRLKNDAQRNVLWRTLSADARMLKERLLKEGRIALTACEQNISCTTQELERHPIFRQAVGEISDLFEGCLGEVVKAVDKNGGRRVGVLLAGGGANIASLRAAIEKICSRKGAGALQHLAATPSWVDELADAEGLKSIFPQLSAACGAALSRGFTDAKAVSAEQPVASV